MCWLELWLFSLQAVAVKRWIIHWTVTGHPESDDGGRSGLAKSLGIPDKCDETFDVGKSGLSEIRCTADKVDVPDTDKLKKVYYTTTKLDAKQRQTIVEGLLDRSQGIYVR